MTSAFGGTVTDGIKDVSALLPLLGTEQCEEHVGSALVGGFLYAAVAPLSLFGSLGIARAGGKALMACIRFRTFMGAKLLRDAGFAPVGKALSQIMWDGECHVAEKQLTEMLEKLHITDVEKLSVEESRRSWNLWLLCCSLPVAVASTMPYIYFIRHDHTDQKYARWLYPLMRSIGGCLTATVVQFIIQTRLLEIIKNRLVFLRLDAIVKQDNIDPPEWWDAKYSSEATLSRLFAKKYRGAPGAEELRKMFRDNLSERAKKSRKQDAQDQSDVSSQNVDTEAGRPLLPNPSNFDENHRHFTTPSYFHCVYIFFIICGMGLSIVGYIGSFTIVSNDGKGNANSNGPLIWLGAEIALSLLRMLIWSLNPLFDEHTNLTFKLELEANNPLPTCNKFSEELEENHNGLIPLARSTEFLGQITSFVGLLEPFESAGVALYYTMSAQRAPTPTKQEPTPTKQQRVLYITIYEYTENISRSFTLVYLPSSKQAKTCYNSTIEVQDYGNNAKDDNEDNIGRLCARLRGKVSMASNHITNNKPFVKKLEEHCASIFSKLQSRAKDATTEIKRTWALTEPPKVPEPQGGIESVSRGESPPSADELAYLRVGELERSKRNFCSSRRTWVDARIAFLKKQKYTYIVGTPEHAAAKYLMLYEWQFLEQMLVYESRELEIILLSSSKMMILRLQQRPEGRNLDAVTKEQISEAMRRVKDGQAHANTSLEQLDKEAQSWITDYWGLTQDSLEESTRMFSDPIRQLWEQIIADMKTMLGTISTGGDEKNVLENDNRPPSLSGYDNFLNKALDALVDTLKLTSPTDEWQTKRDGFKRAEEANAAQRDPMTKQLRKDVQTMEEWLELFIPAVHVAVEQCHVLCAYDDVLRGCTNLGSGTPQVR
ncbi:hypothetical protein EYR40_004629 [Pleurotus pulmonarius]|nr:hypothetical protein EYR38_001869 [Pleurotus pulmonarius]KAF4605839.1 hypothetical protein EYR40_004629 [Pleurotus pulmonarius]